MEVWWKSNKRSKCYLKDLGIEDEDKIVVNSEVRGGIKLKI